MSFRIATLLCFSIAAGASAQGSVPPASPAAPPVDELVSQALARAPVLAALRAQVAAAREMEGPAGALPDPMVEAMLQNAGVEDFTVGDEDMSMVTVQVRQGLPYPGKRLAARRVAESETARRAAELAARASEIAAAVRRLYARLYAIDRERKSLAAARELVDLLAATAAARYSAGETEQEAVVKAQLAGSRLAEQLDDLAAERAGMVAELNRWLDRPGEAPLGEVVSLPPGAPPAADLEGLVAIAAPEVAIATTGRTAAENRLAAARLELKPGFAATGGVGYRGALDPMVTLGLAVELPFWRRTKQEPMIRAAEQELEMARSELADARAMARAEAARLAAAWRSADQQVLRYAEAIVPQSSAALDAARASYLAGRGDFSTVVEDFDLWLEARVGMARREADRFAAWADLERLTALTASASMQEPRP